MAPATTSPTAPSVLLHIGLHKTATRFLQRALLRHLDPDAFLVNPPTLMAALRRAVRQPGANHREALADAARAALAEAGRRTLIVSDPGISGDLYNNHADYADNLELIRAVFPEARSLYFVRRPSDWLHSAYRQMLVKGRSAPVEVLLNFRDGAFQPRLAHEGGLDLDGAAVEEAVAAVDVAPPRAERSRFRELFAVDRRRRIESGLHLERYGRLGERVRNHTRKVERFALPATHEALEPLASAASGPQ